MQTLIFIALVVVAILLMLRRVYHQLGSKPDAAGGCGCGCSGCKPADRAACGLDVTE